MQIVSEIDCAIAILNAEVNRLLSPAGRAECRSRFADIERENMAAKINGLAVALRHLRERDEACPLPFGYAFGPGGEIMCLRYSGDASKAAKDGLANMADGVPITIAKHLFEVFGSNGAHALSMALLDVIAQGNRPARPDPDFSDF
jgi:hypothetical protein